MKCEITLFHTMGTNRNVLLQTHLPFVTIYGLVWCSSVNIRWFWSIWKFPITAHPTLYCNVNSLDLMKVLSPLRKNSIQHWASFFLNPVVPFRVDGKANTYNPIFLILIDIYDNTISKRFWNSFERVLTTIVDHSLFIFFSVKRINGQSCHHYYQGKAPRRTSLNRKFN